VIRRYVLTGAPGAGKTVLGRELERQGEVFVAEAASDVIAEAQENGVGEPWTQPGFVDDVVGVQRCRQLETVHAVFGRQLFDRSPLCTLALAEYLEMPVSPLLAGEVDRVVRECVYEHQVFLVRPLGFVTPMDARRISYAESLRFERIHEDVYRDHGYDLMPVPPVSVEERARQVRKVMEGFGRWL
jgi:predicted ATPase